jgi:3',5'-cyclic AMP phosphodiesterase CpdA
VTLNPSVPVSAGTAQMRWLEADLDAHRTKCTAAIWHTPLFSSDSGSSRMREAWRILYQHNAELVISGHHHRYERFAPQTSDGQLDEERGLREFVVGTGGRSLDGVHQGPTLTHSEIIYGGGYGVLKLTLRPSSYEWEFISVEGKSFSDQGSGQCH